MVSMFLALVMVLGMVPVTATAESASGSAPTFSVAFESCNYDGAENTVTFAVTASTYPTVDATVHYRIWSGESEEIVTAQDGVVVFEKFNYESGSTTQYVTVALGSYAEGLDAWELEGATEDPTVQCTLLSVEGQGSID